MRSPFAAQDPRQEPAFCATLHEMTQGEPQETDPLVGTLVAGKYRIVKQLGEGGMGCVYLAEQQLGSTARKVALKTLHKHLSHDPAIKARFDREAGTVAALEHPNTIQVYDFGAMEDGTLYLVMEFVQGRSVADILEKDGAMPPARVENIMRQVCGSLEEAHGHGIVHRDLKPDNVVLCERAGQKDWVEVLDFGIAKRSSEHDPNEAKLTQQGMVLGTPPYMSPEQFTGQPVDARSDIYALGVMAYEMLVGKYPFEANTAWEWASKHMTEAPRPIETQALGANVPDRMRAAITRALAKNKDERFATVKEFYDSFATGASPHTAVMGAAAAAHADGNGAAAVSAPGPNRPMTEMAAPVMGGGPSGPNPGAMTPPYGGGAPPGPSSGGAQVAIPAGPMHGASHGGSGEKKGGMGLVIGLGVLAVLLIGGGITVYALRGKPTAATGDPLAGLSGTASVTAPVESAVVAEEDAGSATPLGGSSGVVATTNTGAKTGTGPAIKPATASVPTPKIKPPDPPKVDPPICFKARDAARRNSPGAPNLLAQCRAAGGVP
jgi:eukaryotic-like serine/threonine-protein kinase